MQLLGAAAPFRLQPRLVYQAAGLNTQPVSRAAVPTPCITLPESSGAGLAMLPVYCSLAIIVAGFHIRSPAQLLAASGWMEHLTEYTTASPAPHVLPVQRSAEASVSPRSPGPVTSRGVRQMGAIVPGSPLHRQRSTPQRPLGIQPRKRSAAECGRRCRWIRAAVDTGVRREG